MEENNVVFTQEAQEAPQQNIQCGPSPMERINALCRDDKFLAVCILYFTSTICAITGLFTFSVPVVETLLTIFFIMAYVKAKSNSIEPKHIKRISGSTLALMIIRFVGCAIVILIGILFNSLMSYFGSEGFANLIFRRKAEIDRYIAVVRPIIMGISSVIMITLIVCAIVAFVLALLGIGSIHKFVKSAYTSAQTGVLDIKASRTARGWLIAFAVFFGIDAFSTSFYLPTLTQYGCMCAAMILLSKLIKQYYGDIQ